MSTPWIRQWKPWYWCSGMRVYTGPASRRWRVTAVCPEGLRVTEDGVDHPKTMGYDRREVLRFDLNPGMLPDLTDGATMGAIVLIYWREYGRYPSFGCLDSPDAFVQELLHETD